MCMSLSLKLTDLCLLQPCIALFSLMMSLFCSQNHNVLNEAVLRFPCQTRLLFSWSHACSLSCEAAEDTEGLVTSHVSPICSQEWQDENQKPLCKRCSTRGKISITSPVFYTNTEQPHASHYEEN